MSVITGCRYLSIEKILEDSVSAYTTDTPIDLTARLIGVNFEPNNLEAKVNADNAVKETFFATPEGKVTIELTYLTPAERAAIFGNTSVGAIRSGGDSSAIPYYLVKYEVTWSDRTVWTELLKVKFVPGPKNVTTKKADSLEPQYVTLEGTAVVRTYKPGVDPSADNLYYEVDSLDASYAGEGATWFTAGDNLSTPDLVAPTLSSVTPADAATNQLATVDIVWVFDKAILPSCMTNANFQVIKNSDGVQVAGAYTQSNSNKTITFNPTASLSAGAEYKAILTTGVKSLAGVALAAGSMTKFTIAA